MRSEKKSKNREQKSKVNCFNCSHFYITHDPQFPYGCEAMGFKSLQLPSGVTFRCSEIECQMFTPKKKH